ncbi:MAG: MarR family transcriptional regulator, partial [Stenotrophomonas sp.]
RPRFTPVVRALDALGPASIAVLARHQGMRHSAFSQTVAQMGRLGLVRQVAGKDGRERIVAPTRKLTAMLPRIRRHWQATNAAAADLDASLQHRLATTVRAALDALDERSFAERARHHFNAGDVDDDSPTT